MTLNKINDLNSRSELETNTIIQKDLFAVISTLYHTWRLTTQHPLTRKESMNVKDIKRTAGAPPWKPGVGIVPSQSK